MKLNGWCGFFTGMGTAVAATIVGTVVTAKTACPAIASSAKDFIDMFLDNPITLNNGTLSMVTKVGDPAFTLPIEGDNFQLSFQLKLYQGLVEKIKSLPDMLETGCDYTTALIGLGGIAVILIAGGVIANSALSLEKNKEAKYPEISDARSDLNARMV